MKYQRGFTLIEALVVSVIASVLVIGCVSFIQVQMKSGLVMHEKAESNALVQSAFQRIQTVFERLRLPGSDATFEQTHGSTFRVQYTAGQHMRNCLGTAVAPTTRVTDEFSLVNGSIRCASKYTDLNGRAKQDRQPFINAIQSFNIRVVSLERQDCIDVIDVVLERIHKVSASPTMSHRILFPSCVETEQVPFLTEEVSS